MKRADRRRYQAPGLWLCLYGVNHSPRSSSLYSPRPEWSAPIDSTLHSDRLPGASAVSPWSIAALRIADSFAAALLGVVVRVLAWPKWERRKLAATSGSAIDAVSSYLQAMQRDLSLGICVSPELLASVRRDACRAIDALDSLAATMRQEMPSCELRTAAADVIVRHLRRLVDTVSPLEYLAAGTSHPDRCRLAAISLKCIDLLRGGRAARDEGGVGAILPADHAPPAFFVQVIAQKATDSAAAVGAVRAKLS